MIATTEPTLAIPLEAVPEAEVRIAFGGGDLRLGPAGPGTLVSGTFGGGVVDRRMGPGRISLEPRVTGSPETWRPRRWDLQVTGEVPLDLTLETGADRSAIDLTALRVRRLTIRTGASETSVRLPSAGRTAVHVTCGFASVVLHVPATMAARIRGRMALGSTDVDEGRFPRTDGGWASPGYDTAVDRIEIELEGGFASARVI